MSETNQERQETNEVGVGEFMRCEPAVANALDLIFGPPVVNVTGHGERPANLNSGRLANDFVRGKDGVWYARFLE